jgi:carbonic anhydrase
MQIESSETLHIHIETPYRLYISCHDSRLAAAKGKGIIAAQHQNL